MSVEKKESGVCKACPMDAANEVTHEVIEKYPQLFGGSSKNVVLGTQIVREYMLSSLARKIDCPGPEINQHKQRICPVVSALNNTISNINGPNDKAKGALRFEALVDDDEEDSGLYL